MKHRLTAKSLASVALALGVLVAASAAQASSSVYFSIGVQQPERYVQQPNRYVQSVPIYVQPRAVYLSEPVQYPRYDDHRRFRGHHGQENRFYRDQDRDGIWNRYDRDRDGDGVPNRYDRQPNNPYRR